MSALAIATEVLIVAAILAGILVHAALPAALRSPSGPGASRSYILAVAWTFGFVLIALGSLIGLGVAMLLVGVVSGIFSEASGIALSTGIGSPEVVLAVALTGVGALLALLPRGASLPPPGR